MLQHVSLEVRPDQVEACVGFWALLGFEPVEPPAALEGRAAWVERQGTQIHLLRTEAPVAAPRGHAAVVVEDYAGALEQLRAAGFSPGPAEPLWGAPRAFVRDPAGHRVELMSAPPTG